MSSINLMIAMGIGVIVALLVVIFWVPSSPGTSARSSKKKDLAEKAEQKPEQRDTLIFKLEKQIDSLRGQMDTLSLEQKKNLKELEIEKIKNTKLEEKLLQEKEWFTREQAATEKRQAELRQFKENLTKAEGDFEKEYSLRLELERQLKGTKEDYAVLDKEKREAASGFKQLEAELSTAKKELDEQKKINAELVKKNEETAWVSKAEHEKLQQLLEQKEKDLIRLQQSRG